DERARPDRAGDAVGGGAHGQELLVLLAAGDGLDRDRRLEPLRPGGRVEVLDAEGPPDRRPRLVHPGVGPPPRVPEVGMGVAPPRPVPRRPAGVGTWPGSRPLATRSAQSASGTGHAKPATASSTSAAERAPTSTLVTAGWPNGKASAAARRGVPGLAQTSASRTPRAPARPTARPPTRGAAGA